MFARLRAVKLRQEENVEGEREERELEEISRYWSSGQEGNSGISPEMLLFERLRDWRLKPWRKNQFRVSGLERWLKERSREVRLNPGSSPEEKGGKFRALEERFRVRTDGHLDLRVERVSVRDP